MKGHLAGLSGEQYIPSFGPVGAFADDPHFEEFTRLVRAERERVNCELQEEFDREREAEIVAQ